MVIRSLYSSGVSTVFASTVSDDRLQGMPFHWPLGSHRPRTTATERGFPGMSKVTRLTARGTTGQGGTCPADAGFSGKACMEAMFGEQVGWSIA